MTNMPTADIKQELDVQKSAITSAGFYIGATFCLYVVSIGFATWQFFATRSR